MADATVVVDEERNPNAPTPVVPPSYEQAAPVDLSYDKSIRPETPPPAPGARPSADPFEAFARTVLPARERAAASLEAKAAALRPRMGSAVAFSDARQQQLAATPQPATPTLPPPPSRALSGFLAPRDNEPPAASVSKLITAIGLFAAGASGLVKGDARGSLAALTGALSGWHEGDAERADRAFSDWKAKTDRMMKQHEMDVGAWERWIKQGDLTESQMLTGIKLKAAEMGLPAEADIFKAQTAADALAFVTGRQDAGMKFGLEKEKIEAARENAQARLEAARQAHEDAMALRRDAETNKAQRFDEMMAFRKENQEREAQAFTPDSLEYMAKQYYLSGVLPPMGMGRASTEARVKILNRAAEIAKEAGSSPEAQIQRTQMARALQGELNRELAQRGIVLPFAHAAENNLKVALELSEEVDRTGVPVFNRWMLAGKRSVQGDPDVSAFDAATRTVINEYAKVTSGTAAGSDTSRREIGEILNTAQTKEQFRAVAATLRREMAGRIKGYADHIQTIQESVRHLGTGASPAPPAKGAATPPRPGMIRVKRKSDGSTGWLDPKDAGDLYEVLR